MTFTYDDGEGIYLGDEIEIPDVGQATVLRIRKDGKRIRVQHISDYKDSIEWIDVDGCEMIRRNQ